MAGAAMPSRVRAFPTLNPNTPNCRSASAVTISTYAIGCSPRDVRFYHSVAWYLRHQAASLPHRSHEIDMSSSGKPRSGATRGSAPLGEVDVPVARVWRALTDPGLIRIWSGQEEIGR